MQIGEQAEGGIYAGKINGHHIICSPIEYDLPFEVNWHQAVDYCKALGMELPSKEELNLLFKMYEATPEYFPKREYLWYWSSTEHMSTYVWRQYFGDGSQYRDKRTDSNYVRPIKRIKV